MSVKRSSQYLAVSNMASAQFTNPMLPGQMYYFNCNVDCWVRVTTTGGAAAANTADNILFKASQEPMALENPDTSITTNAFVHVIGDTAAGDAVLMLIERAHPGVW